MGNNPLPQEDQPEDASAPSCSDAGRSYLFLGVHWAAHEGISEGAQACALQCTCPRPHPKSSCWMFLKEVMWAEQLCVAMTAGKDGGFPSSQVFAAPCEPPELPQAVTFVSP